VGTAMALRIVPLINYSGTKRGLLP